MSQAPYLLYGVVASAVFHGLLLMSLYDHDWRRPQRSPSYFEVDISGLSGLESMDAIARAALHEEIRVAHRTLPQLPRHMPISAHSSQNTPQEDSQNHHENGVESLLSSEIKSQALAVIRQKRSQMAHEEFTRRLLKDKARREKKTARKLSSPSTTQTQLKQRVSASGGSAESDPDMTRFLADLQKTISRSYELPEVYLFESRALTAAVKIALDSQGGIRRMSIYRSSGDSLFDAMSMNVIRNSKPLPHPPRSYDGQAIVVHFSPFDHSVGR